MYRRYGDDENSTQGIISERDLLWWKDPVRELWNRPRSSVQLKYSVNPALKDIERVIVILIAN